MRHILFLLLFLLIHLDAVSQKKSSSVTSEDPYLTKLYWKLNDSPMQQKLRRLKPFPVSVVYYQQTDHNLDSIRKTFQTIRELGFTSLKQIELKGPLSSDSFEQVVFNTALDEDLYPWYYGMGGWKDITPQLVKERRLKIDYSSGNMRAIQNDPAIIRWQKEYLRKRIERMKSAPKKPAEMGEPGRNYPFITSRLIPSFAKWLENQYGTIDKLKQAWGNGHTRNVDFESFSEAAQALETTGIDAYGNRTGQLTWDIRSYRDAMRFQADLKIQDYTTFMRTYYEWDPDEPNRTGGHQLFENQALNGWDLEGQAKAATLGGSFYASIHLPHHFFLADHELIRPLYMQSRIVADMFKGGWAATWESTGGSTQWSGYQGYSVDGTLMKKMMLTYIAAGLKGIGIWTWNSRDVGWEAGEYALTNLQGRPTERARVAGQISKKLQEHRFELWDALDEPVVGVLYSWENEALLGRLSLGLYQLSTPVYQTTRDADMRQYHADARMGISRALINHNIPFEYVTERDLNAGLAGRYKIIYLPSVLTLNEASIQRLEEFVKAGGRVVADMPLLMFDTYGKLQKYRMGSQFEKMFGFQVEDYANSFNNVKILDQDTLEGQFASINLTHGKIKATFQDGTPSMLESVYGKGSTTVFNFEAARSVKRPGNVTLENFITKNLLSSTVTPFYVDGDVIVYRRSAPLADHYFIINESQETKVTIRPNGIQYTSAIEVLADQSIKLIDNSIKLSVPANGALWIRAEKKN